MRILLIATVFAAPGRSPWLLDDLAEQFRSTGHEVDVLVADARGRGSDEDVTAPAGMRVLDLAPPRSPRGRFAKLRTYLHIGWQLHTTGWRFARENGPYDVVLWTSIAAFAWGFPSRVRRKGIAAQALVILWDFFPVHQFDIGRIRARWAGPLLKSIERAAIHRADVIAVMSPANERFLRTYFPSLPARAIIVPPWSSSGNEKPDLGRWQSDTFRVIFGGQLTYGRGISSLIAAARTLSSEPDLGPYEIIIAGDGPDRRKLEEEARDISAIRFTRGLPRDEYRALLTTAHLGIAITVAGVTPPTFPSKISEYCGLGVPVIVAVEGSSDAGELVDRAGAGFALAAGDVGAICAALRTAAAEFYAGSLVERGTAARALWESQLSVESAAAKIAEAVGPMVGHLGTRAPS